MLSKRRKEVENRGGGDEAGKAGLQGRNDRKGWFRFHRIWFTHPPKKVNSPRGGGTKPTGPKIKDGWAAGERTTS
jgi:hypothetical protein